MTKTTGKLPEDIKQRLLGDYSVAQSQIDDLLNNPDINGLITSYDYLGPTINNINIPLEHPKGEFQYFSSIRKVLETALITGSIPRELLPTNAPDYLCDLVRGEKQKV